MQRRKLVSFRLRAVVYRVLLASAKARGISVRQVAEEILTAHIEPLAATVAAQEVAK